MAEEVGAHHEVESVARARRPIGSLDPGVADDRVELLIHLCGRPGHAVEGAEVELVDIVVPDPGPGEAVVKVESCGVCHTDLHYREGGINDDFPFLLGHEAAGIVEAVGEGVTDVAPGDFVMATGSPGGGAIIQYVLKTVVGALDWGLDAQQATSLVNFGAANSPTTGVDGSNTTLDLSGLIAGLKEKGHTVNPAAQSSGVATIMRITKDGKRALQGGADPRREGIVLGDGAL